MTILGAAGKIPGGVRTIGEVSVELEVPQHVLRFGESRFPQLKPLKRGGGRRYYRPDDLDLLRGIRSLLYSDGMTIKGVQKILREQGQRYVMELGRGAVTLIPPRAQRAKSEPAPEPARRPTCTHSRASPRPRPGQPPHERRRARAFLQPLLDELLELKSRLRSARRRTRLAP